MATACTSFEQRTEAATMELISSHQSCSFAASADGSRSVGSLWRLEASARFSIGFGSKLLSCTQQQRVLLLIPAHTQSTERV
jgi:hypothetical protein